MKIITRSLSIIVLLATTCTFFGCTTDDPLEPSKDHTEQPEDKPEDGPSEEYVRLSLSSGDNNQNLTFDWEDIKIGSDKTKYLSFFVSDGEKPIYGKSSNESGAQNNGVAYSGMTVTPYDGDSRRAYFQTVDYYDVTQFATPTYCFAVAGNTPIAKNVNSGQNLFHIEMPSSFVQKSTDNPDFLKKHITMYASTSYDQNESKLDFTQVPAILKFIVKNTTSSVVFLHELSVSASYATTPMTESSTLPVGSSSADLSFDWTNGDINLVFAGQCHNHITVSTGNGISLEEGETYTAYSAVLPLSEENAFADKVINISVKTNAGEHIAAQIDCAKLAELNSADIYNWVSGQTYTIDINLDKDGSVTGRILSGNQLELTSSVPGTYTLKYIGADGLPLGNYSEICTLTINQSACYEDFIDVNIAPRNAEAIGIYDTSNYCQGTISISNLKPECSERPVYRFGLLSDVHMGRSSSSNAEADFENALNFFSSNNVAMVCICGDITQNQKEAEYKSYASIASKSSSPVYTTTGNHDCMGTDGVNPRLWDQHTGLPIVFERSVEINGKIDHYLFLGMSYYDFVAAYFEHHLDWLEDKLEEYRNDRCFVFTHLFFPERAGNLNGIYPDYNWLRGTQHDRLIAMCNRYVNTIWFSGHSHWKWSLQKYQAHENIHRLYEGGQQMSGWSVHVPSCADPINSNGTSRDNVPAESEGAIVEVYENHIDMLGVDLLTGKYFPIATYRLNTSLQPVAPRTTARQEHYLKASNFVVNTSRPGATVTDIEGMPNYVEVNFTDKNQGFYISNSTYTSNSSKVVIIVEDIKAYSNGVLVDVPANAGFYLENLKYYNLTTKVI